MKTLRILPLLLAASLTPALSQAQSSLATQTNGAGAMTYNGVTRKVKSVRISLSRNGDFDISISGDQRATVTGTWRRGRSGQYALTIERVGRDRANGTGSLTVDRRDEVDALTFSGFAAQKKFNVTFEGGAPGGFGSDDNRNDRNDRNNRDDSWGGNQTGSEAKFRDFNGGKSGSGGLDFDRRMKVIDRAEVRLNRSGSFEINFRGVAKFKVIGTWRWKGNDIELRVDDTLGDNRASGSGTLYINRNGDDFWKITLRGRAKGKVYNVGFNE